MQKYIKKYARLVYSPYAVALFVFVLFLAVNWSFYGPAYLSDEVGYLNKAATLAGQTVHVTSSWFGGYSILISPAYFVSNNPYVQWKIVLILNAVMWAGISLLLNYILKKLRPKASPRMITAATVVAMLYPAWISMSGYAFATTGFVLVFVSSLACLLRSNVTSYKWLFAAALLVGYLFWIHPLGGVYVAFFIVFTALIAYIQRKWMIATIPLISGLSALSYILFFSPFINHLMKGNNAGHYSETLTNISSTIFTPVYWMQFGLIVLGLIFSVLIATFGVIAFSIQDVIKKWSKPASNWKKMLINLEISIPLLLLLTLCGVIVINAASSASNTHLRVDEWVYGRYVDMFILPLIGLGFLVPWKRKSMYVAIGIVLVTGLLLSIYTNSQNTLLELNNKVNIQSLWPMHISALAHIRNYFIWGLLGACGLAVTLYAAHKRNEALIAVFLLPVLCAGAANFIYHRTALTQHSTISTPIYNYVKTSYTADECIGFTLQGDSSIEGFSLYSYYLHGYNVQQMSVNDWLKQDCKGPYLTYDIAVANTPGAVVKNIDSKTGLLMITRR